MTKEAKATKDPRAPQVFWLDEEQAGAVASSHKRRKPQAEITFAEDWTDTALVSVPQTQAPVRPPRFRWATLLLSSLFSLLVLWSVNATIQMIQGFFAQSVWLGWLSTGVATVAAIAALAIILKELTGLLRLNRIEALQEKAARAINLDEDVSSREVIAELSQLYAGRTEMAEALRQLGSHAKDIIDPSDRVKLADRILLTPLDAEAHRIIAGRAKRVTLLTTVTPAAALDMLFVGSQNIAMVRDLATLYGGKPSTLATLKLARMVVTHLAVAGGLALSDNFIHLFVGKGVLGRLSARFGEGAVNGILTSRIGLATMEVCRPVPKPASARESLPHLLKEVLRFDRKPNAEAD